MSDLCLALWRAFKCALSLTPNFSWVNWLRRRLRPPVPPPCATPLKRGVNERSQNFSDFEISFSLTPNFSWVNWLRRRPRPPVPSFL